MKTENCDVVVVDCLTLWLSNLILADDIDDDTIEEEVSAFLSVIQSRRYHLILVTNEVGMGIVPENELARRFRDVAGRTHRRIAKIADQVYCGQMGVMLRLKPGPVESVTMETT